MMEFKDELRSKKLYLLDMDGTLYLDDDLFPHCLDFLNAIRERGGDYLYLTNNSSKSVDKYVEKLQRIGIPAHAEEFFTSTDAACVYLKENYHGNKLYAFGTASFRDQLSNAGFPIVDRLEPGIDGIIMGYDTELTYQKLDDTCRLLTLNPDIMYVATNPDWVCPTAYGYVPDCGSVSQMIYNATKRKPYFIGKPEPAIARLAMAKKGRSPEESVLVGDRIYTDIACGVNAGMTTVLVFSGETTREDWEKSEVKPTFTCESIADIWEAIS